MIDLDHIFEKNKEWVAEKLGEDPDYFENLAKGQSPIALYIGCSDSRVTAEQLMGAKPGEVFVHRNVANLVVNTDNNINAVVQFAIEYLNIQHIIVCGHYECGGIKAALYPSDMGQLNSWLQTLRDVYRFHQKELDAISDSSAKLDRLVELNVQEQCINVIKIDHVQRSWFATGLPKIHGWVFDVRSGILKDLNLDIEAIFSEVRKIYDIQPE